MDEVEIRQLPAFLTVQEVAKVLRLKRSTAYELIKQGRIPSVRLGRFIRIPKSKILEMGHLSTIEGKQKANGEI